MFCNGGNMGAGFIASALRLADVTVGIVPVISAGIDAEVTPGTATAPAFKPNSWLIKPELGKVIAAVGSVKFAIGATASRFLLLSVAGVFSVFNLGMAPAPIPCKMAESGSWSKFVDLMIFLTLDLLF